MIRRLSILSVLLAVGIFFLGTTAAAQQPLPMTNEHIQRIKDNCRAATQTLRQIRASDGLLRVNRGQLYDLISTKLMAPMNSRLAINRLDASQLISVTASFDRTLNEFRSHYQTYGAQLLSTIQTDCQQKPVEFYEGVKKAREQRAKINELIKSLVHYIAQYDQKFNEFRANHPEIKREGDDT